mmetsp:Transcript_35238/g.92870  ORF Transcript_35238/g.92870 Transcript_35238/m.92870 type:complete len:222 (+) Transcript_35238:407-1072(+)
MPAAGRDAPRCRRRRHLRQLVEFRHLLGMLPRRLQPLGSLRLWLAVGLRTDMRWDPGLSLVGVLAATRVGRGRCVLVAGTRQEPGRDGPSRGWNRYMRAACGSSSGGVGSGSFGWRAPSAAVDRATPTAVLCRRLFGGGRPAHGADPLRLGARPVGCWPEPSVASVGSAPCPPGLRPAHALPATGHAGNAFALFGTALRKAGTPLAAEEGAAARVRRGGGR